MTITKKKGSPSKRKGSTWERAICKFLGDVIGGSFIRVPNSGAFIGRSNSVRKDYLSGGQIRAAKGDIIPPDNLPKLVIEAKSYKDFPFHQLMSPGNCKQIDEWISQTKDCIDDGDVWFLIIKINNKGSYICYENKLKDEFVIGNHVCYNDYIVTEMETFVKENKDTIIRLCT